MGKGADSAIVRIRIYGIGGIFRIALRPTRAFAIIGNYAKRNMDKRLPASKDARRARIL